MRRVHSAGVAMTVQSWRVSARRIRVPFIRCLELILSTHPPGLLKNRMLRRTGEGTRNYPRSSVRGRGYPWGLEKPCNLLERSGNVAVSGVVVPGRAGAVLPRRVMSGDFLDTESRMFWTFTAVE